MLVDKANQQDTQLTAFQLKIKEYSKTETDMLDARATSEQFSREVKVCDITDGSLVKPFAIEQSE